MCKKFWFLGAWGSGELCKEVHFLGTGGCARVFCSSCKGGQGLEILKREVSKVICHDLKKEKHITNRLLGDQKVEVASNRLPGPCGLGTFWSFIPKVSGL